jgi:hypothetical protein
VFRDQKLGGVEIILHGERIATDEVRLLPTPEQWDPVPRFTARKHGAAPDQLIAYSGYPELSLGYPGGVSTTFLAGTQPQMSPMYHPSERLPNSSAMVTIAPTTPSFREA